MDFENLISFTIICLVLATFGIAFFFVDVGEEGSDSVVNNYAQSKPDLYQGIPKWDHNMLTYSYEIIQSKYSDGVYKCFDKRKTRIKQSFEKISSKTNNVVTFKEIENGTGDIIITCNGRNLNAAGTEATLGLAGYSYTDGIIDKATLEFFVEDSDFGTTANSSCLNTELHEILHLFGFDHNEGEGEIMNSIQGSICIDEIPQYIIFDLIRMYEVEK